MDRALEEETGGVTDTEGVRRREERLEVVEVSSDTKAGDARSSIEGMGTSASSRGVREMLEVAAEPAPLARRYNNHQMIRVRDG